MVYLLQAEEQEISFDLLQQLAAVLVRPPEVTLADATHLVHHSHGIFEMPDEAEAARVAKGFAALGFATLTAPELLPLPTPPEPLNLHQPELDGPVALAVAGELHLIREQDQWEYKEFVVASEYGAYSFPDQMRIDEDKLPHREVQYYLDLCAGGRRWRARAEFEHSLREVLAKVDLNGALLGVGAQHLLAQNRRLPVFEKLADYERYVSWLYQLRRLKKQD